MHNANSLRHPTKKALSQLKTQFLFKTFFNKDPNSVQANWAKWSVWICHCTQCIPIHGWNARQDIKRRTASKKFYCNIKFFQWCKLQRFRQMNRLYLQRLSKECKTRSSRGFFSRKLFRIFLLVKKIINEWIEWLVEKNLSIFSVEKRQFSRT